MNVNSIKEKINSFRKTLNKSPLIGYSEVLDEESKVEARISSVSDHLEILEDKMKKKLKIVIMGEVKAGKSTLLNAIAGETIAPVDVLEATAAISDIHYGEKEEAVIYKGEEIIEIGSIEEIYKILNEHKNDTNFFEGKAHVSITLNNEALKEFHLVDTPGLSSFTDANVEKTRNYIQESDLVLWVLNGNHIGQSDVQEELSRVSGMGKPVIMIVNRIDEVNAPSQKIKKHVKKTLGIYTEEVFCLSAIKAFEARENESQKLLQESGLAEILEYIRTEIEVDSDAVKNESISSSINSLIKNYYSLNQIYYNRLNFKLNEIKEYTARLESEKYDIDKEIKYFLIDKFNKELFEKQKNDISKIIDKGSSGMFGNSSKSKLKNYLENKIDKDAVIEWWQSVQSDLVNKMKEEWLSVTEKIDEEIEEDAKALTTQEKIMISAMDNSHWINNSTFNSELTKGALLAGAGGVTAAAYLAAIGPGAAFITFGGAVASLVPPIALSSALVFGISRFLKSGKESKKLKLEIFRQIEDAKKDLKENWLKKELIPAIREKNKSIKENVKNDFSKKLSGGLKINELLALKEKEENYLKELENYLTKNEINELIEFSESK